MSSNRVSFRDRMLSIHYPSDSDLRFGLWNPLNPPFDPVFSLKDISQPQCPKFYFLKHIKGRDPQYKIIFRTPNQRIENSAIYRRFFKHKKAFNLAIIRILKYIVWNNEGNRLIREPLDSPIWGNILRQAIDPDLRDSTIYLRNFFHRLQEEGILNRYLNSRGSIYFNFQIFNPEIYLPLSEDGMLYELELRRTDRSPRPYRYRWDGPFPGYSIIPEINLERHELVSYLFYSHEFIRLNHTNQNFTNFENQMFIIPNLHFLWLLRLAISTLNTDYLQNFHIDLSEVPLFRSINNDQIPSAQEFSRYRLRLETLDQTYTEDMINDLDLNFPLRTAQALIILKLLHGRRPNLVLNISDECLVSENRYEFCGLRGNLGCAYRDYVRFPPAVVYQNVLTFQEYIRDEITIKSSNFYFIYQFLRDILELKNFIGIWLGHIIRRNDVLYFQCNELFEDDIPREHNLNIAFWSPFFFPADLEVRLVNDDDGTIIREISDNPINSQNLMDLFNIFSINNMLPILVGDFPNEENMRNYRRQQKAIWVANNYIPPERNEDETHHDYEMRILSRRLRNNDRRAGEGVFGNRVRFT
ncbi:MAG: hypothetical protein ACFFAN_05365 [Promethearchaeota archaeon]